ncbi:MAG: ERF family protein [Candidatus Binataceae bacterium]
MKTTLECKDDFLYIVEEKDGPTGSAKKCFPVRRADYAEAQTLHGRPVRSVNQQEGVYVDEEGNVYQLTDKGETRPIEVEHLPGRGRTELEELLEASLKEGKATGQNSGPKRLLKKNRRSDRKQQALQMATAKPEALLAEAPPAVERSASTVDVAAPEDLVRLNLRQKLAEVRRRIGYVQKRGHNERFNYSYVTAADIAGAIGDLLAELGVIVIPRLEEISYESAAARGDAVRMARVVMAYSFSDVESGEEIVAKVAGQGLDSGDKAPYKAMTGALKYALLQSFLLATGDDPEDERPDARYSTGNHERPISADEIRTLKTLIDETGTDLERVLAYYKVASLEAMTEASYRRAVEVLNRKLAKQSNQETVHAQD